LCIINFFVIPKQAAIIKQFIATDTLQ